MDSRLPIAVIGAGPIGLAAAAHLVRCGQSMVVIEAGPTAGYSVRAWAHVPMFTPWKYIIDGAARDLLIGTGWREPELEHVPTGGEWFERYLQPLASLSAIDSHIVRRTRVIAVTRQGRDKASSEPRIKQPFTILVRNDWGSEFEIAARAVIDASGTWDNPNPAGSNGIAARGECACAGQIHYHAPDVIGRDRRRYAGKRVLVLGSGHLALSMLTALGCLKDEVPSTSIVWALREPQFEEALQEPDHATLPVRAALASRVYEMIADQAVEVVDGFHINHIGHGSGGLLEIVGSAVTGSGFRVTADELIVANGFRPDLSFLRELRIQLDPALECVQGLAPLLDPSSRSCWTVEPHGAIQLRHLEDCFYIVGTKSYGRTQTFLAVAGYEQVRSIVEELSGHPDDAARIDLVLPKRQSPNGASIDLPRRHFTPKRPAATKMDWSAPFDDRERP
jgi:hypothetical protein